MNCQDDALSETAQKIIIDTCISTFEIYYIYPGKVAEIKEYVNHRYGRGDYQGIKDINELAHQLRRDFRLVTNDSHIWIDVIENLPVSDSDVSDKEQTEELSENNFGFSEFEVLTGNIAYLKIDAFVDLKFGKDTAYAIMNRLQDCDAIIFDLRDNHGGNENMVRYLASFFFEGKVQLNSLYFRFADSLVTGWTDPGICEKKIIRQRLFILTSESTSSAAESFTYVMKNFNRATIVGQNTKGAAHWKETFVLREHGIFLEIPVAYPLNPVTGRDWEGSGIAPDISVSANQALEKAIILAKEWMNQPRQE
ncbi:MAG: S41 family peptidase [Bacteroidales bacterium]|nr:S41 family peptidase [Bacteroidales bacterium]